MDRKRRSDASETATADQPVCPECRSTSLVDDPEKGELVCENCGLVITERRIERGPEWRAYEPEERSSLIARCFAGFPCLYFRRPSSTFPTHLQFRLFEPGNFTVKDEYREQVVLEELQSS